MILAASSSCIGVLPFFFDRPSLRLSHVFLTSVKGKKPAKKSVDSFLPKSNQKVILKNQEITTQSL